MVAFPFNLMAIVFLIANLFLMTKNDIIVHYNKFPNLGVYHTTFPNLKGPRALPKIVKKIPGPFWWKTDVLWQMALYNSITQ